jgi:SMC interacting uncharacterized protein involved in chromosome segregation
MPAVHELDDIMALYALGGHVAQFKSEGDPRTYEVDKDDLRKEGKEESMEKELQEKIAALEGEAKTLKDQIAAKDAEIKVLSEERDGLKKQADDARLDKFKAEVTANLDRCVAEKKITPHGKELLFTLIMNANLQAEKKYKVGEKEFDSVQALVLEFVNAEKPLPTEPETGVGEKQTADLTAKAKKYAEEHKVSFKEALSAVSPAVDPRG